MFFYFFVTDKTLGYVFYIVMGKVTTSCACLLLIVLCILFVMDVKNYTVYCRYVLLKDKYVMILINKKCL